MRKIKHFLSWLFSFVPNRFKNGEPVTILPPGRPKEFNRAKADKVLDSGYAWNPFLKYPRNEDCYCGSEIKYKNCCINTDPDAVPEEFAKKADRLIKRMHRAVEKEK